MAYTIGELSINISAKAGDASRSVRSLATAVKNLKTECSDLSGIVILKKELADIAKIDLSAKAQELKDIAAGYRAIKNASKTKNGTINAKGTVEQPYPIVPYDNTPKDIVPEIKLPVKLDFEAPESLSQLPAVINELPTVFTGVRDSAQEADIWVDVVVRDVKEAVHEATVESVADATEMKEEIIDEWEGIPEDVKQGILNPTAEQIKILTDSIKNNFFNRTFGTMLSSLNGFSAGIKKRLSAITSRITRIAGYRLIRSAIAAVTKEFREGLEVAYEWSANAENGFTGIAKAMDSLASVGAQMKNQLGAAFGQLMVSLAPFFNWLKNEVIVVSNALTEFFAAFAGETQYMKALPIETKWKDIEDKEKDATKALKDYKQQLLGIDELNILNTPSDKAGAIAEEVPTEPIYELAPVEKSWSTELAINLKDVLFNWDNLSAQSIGLKICAGLGAVTGGIIGFTLGGVGGALLGSIAGVILGVSVGSVLFDTEKAQYAPNTTQQDIEDAIAGGLIGASIGFYAGGVAGALVGFSIGAIVTIVANQFSDTIEEKAWQEYLNSEFGQHLEDFYDNHIKKDLEISAELLAKVDSVDVEFSDDPELKNIAYAKKLIEDIFTLDAIEVKTPEELAELKLKIEAVNNLKLDGIQIEFDNLTGKVKTNRDELELNIKKLEETARVKAATNTYNKLIEAQVEIEDELKIATDDLETAMSDLSKANGEALLAQDELAEAQDEWRAWCEEHGYPAIQGMTTYTAEETEELEALNKKVQKASIRSQAMSDAQQKASKSVADAKTAVANLTKAHEKAAEKANKMIKIIYKETEAIDGIKKSIKEATTAIADNITELGKWDKELGTKRTIDVDYAIGVDMTDAAMIAMQKGISGKTFAGGGFPEGGHLFFANENGNPEYIGNMGGRTAVANSDQMSAAIEAASYAGMSRALAENSNNPLDDWKPMSAEEMYLVLKKKSEQNGIRTGMGYAF